ncbi:sporulation initiation factor Spo0A C-terminal domain-containing protein [Lachnospiraceae bacterium 48-33]
MKNELTILLVEDNPVECQSLIDCINNSEKLVLVANTNSAYQASDYIQEYYPDIIILDLELHMGSGTGLDVLNNLKNLHLGITPYILVTTNNTSSIIHEFTRQSGADFIMTKNQADYSAKNVINFILMLYDVIQNKCYPKTELPIVSATDSPHLKKQRLRQKIHIYLNSVGINPKVLGYTYLTDAIELSIHSKTEHLSDTIAKTYRKSPASIERAMQNAINKAWSTCDIDTLEQNYTARIQSDRGVPTITEFICYYAIKIRDSENFLY